MQTTATPEKMEWKGGTYNYDCTLGLNPHTPHRRHFKLSVTNAQQYHLCWWMVNLLASRAQYWAGLNPTSLMGGRSKVSITCSWLWGSTRVGARTQSLHTLHAPALEIHQFLWDIVSLLHGRHATIHEDRHSTLSASATSPLSMLTTCLEKTRD